MNFILSYIRLILFTGGTLAGLQLPAFVDQYGKSLEAHYLEAGRSLSQFQKDADRYFDGNMESLIHYYEKNNDPVFNDGGKSLRKIYDRHAALMSALADFKKGWMSAYIQTFISPVSDIQEEVKATFSYVVKLDNNSLVAGLSVGLIMAAMTEVVLRLLWGLFKQPSRRYF